MLPSAGMPSTSGGADIGALQQKMLKQRQLALKRKRDLAQKVPHVAAAQHDLPVLAERALQKAPHWGSLLLEVAPMHSQIPERSCIAAEPTFADSLVPARPKVATTSEPLARDDTELLAAKESAEILAAQTADTYAPASVDAETARETELAPLSDAVDAVRISDVDSDSGLGSIPLVRSVVELVTSPAPPIVERPKRAGGLGGLGLAGPSSRKDGPTGGWDLEIHNEDVSLEDTTAKQGSKLGRRLWRPWRSSSNRARTVQIVVEEADQVASFSGVGGTGVDNESESGELRHGTFAGVLDGRAATPWPESVAALMGTLGDEHALPGVLNCDD